VGIPQGKHIEDYSTGKNRIFLGKIRFYGKKSDFLEKKIDVFLKKIGETI
jgi:hypothetical protein